MASYIRCPKNTLLATLLYVFTVSSAFAQQQEAVEVEPTEPPQEVVVPKPTEQTNQALSEPEIIVEDNADANVKANEQANSQNVKTRSGRTVITLESTIVGDKEQPKVLSIVPWQRPEHKTMKTAPVTRRIESTFQPIEEDSLNRELNYYKKSKQ